jgi:hypothetical protein
LAEQFANELGGDVAAYVEPLLAREKLGSTAIRRSDTRFSICAHA